MKVYNRFADAVEFEIVQPLGEYVGDFDVDAIADEVIARDFSGAEPAFWSREDVDFWEVVQRHER